MEWIACKDRLPEKSGEYLIYYRYGGYELTSVVHYSAKHKMWNMFDDLDPEETQTAYKDVLAWMPVPEYKG